MFPILVKVKNIVMTYKGIPDDDLTRESMYAEISNMLKSEDIDFDLCLNFEVEEGLFTGNVYFQNDLKNVVNLEIVNV